VVFLDVGYRHTIVVFGRADEICFVKHIAIGTSHFDEEVAATLGTPVDAELRAAAEDEPWTPPCVPVDAEYRDGRWPGNALCLRYYTVTFWASAWSGPSWRRGPGNRFCSMRMSVAVEWGSLCAV
jgi:hypothetical protein